jgi:hypothetical protein
MTCGDHEMTGKVMLLRHRVLGAALLAALLGGCGQQQEPAAPVAPAPASAPTSPVDPTASVPAPVAATPSVPVDPAPQKASPAAPPAPGSTTRPTELKEQPFIDARTLTTLPASSALGVIERQGGWLRVTAAGQQGWVRMLNVRTGSADAAAGVDVQAVAGLATGRAGSGNIVATSGIRGLDAQQLRSAEPDLEQLERLESSGSSRREAEQYAAGHGLAATPLAYLAAPAGAP